MSLWKPSPAPSRLRSWRLWNRDRPKEFGTRLETGDRPNSVWHEIREAARLLANSGCQEPQSDAELLLGHVVGMSRAQIYSRPEYELSAEKTTRYRCLVLRRTRGEPLAYITGHKPFYNLDFLVDPRVLIPRTETELLVERALDVGVAQLEAGRRPVIADIGTGCGAIAICLAVNQPEATVYAVDISAAALEVAALNCQRHGVEARVTLLRGDLMQPLPEPASLVVANLPYVARHELEELPSSIRRYEPLTALDGGDDGLEQIERLLSQAGTKLTADATILLEIGARQGAAARALAEQYFPDAGVVVVPDYAGLDRLVVISSAGGYTDVSSHRGCPGALGRRPQTCGVSAVRSGARWPT